MICVEPSTGAGFNLVSAPTARLARVTEPAVLCAWGDESIRTVGVPEPIYLLGAAIADQRCCDKVRDHLRNVPRAGHKLHWRDADVRHRRGIHQAVSAMPVAHLVVVAAPADPRRPERARAKCLERMLHELDNLGIDRLIMEARTSSLNRRDLILIDRLRGSHRIPTRIRLMFELPSIEPMLWLPDQILGMIGDAEAGDDRWLSAPLTNRVTRIDLRL